MVNGYWLKVKFNILSLLVSLNSAVLFLQYVVFLAPNVHIMMLPRVSFIVRNNTRSTMHFESFTEADRVMSLPAAVYSKRAAWNGCSIFWGWLGCLWEEHKLPRNIPLSLAT